MKKLRLSEEWALIATCVGPFSFLTAVTNEWYGEKLTWNPETEEIVNASSVATYPLHDKWVMVYCSTWNMGARND